MAFARRLVNDWLTLWAEARDIAWLPPGWNDADMIALMKRPAAVVAALSALLVAAPAAAHPHVWVTARSEVLYDGNGEMTGVRHVWTFDEAYSAFAVQGLDKDGDGKFSPEELRELAEVNVDSLNEYDYFTVAKANGVKVTFARPTDYGLTYDNGALTLTFTLPAARPARADKLLSLEVYDPTYFVSFAMAEGEDAVRLTDSPSGCKTSITRPKTPDPAKMQDLSESFFENLSANSTFGADFANRVLVACP